MLIKKLSRILAISAIAFVAVLLWNTQSSRADESSKLLNSAAIQKIVKKGTLMLVSNKMSQILVTTQLKPIPIKGWKLTSLRKSQKNLRLR